MLVGLGASKVGQWAVVTYRILAGCWLPMGVISQSHAECVAAVCHITLLLQVASWPHGSSTVHRVLGPGP